MPVPFFPPNAHYGRSWRFYWRSSYIRYVLLRIRRVVTNAANNMIDRHARDQAIDLIDKALSGGITNFKLDDLWPTSEDKALSAIGARVWTTYNDGREYTLDRKQFDVETVEMFERCIQFLKTNMEYPWPAYDFAGNGLSFWQRLFKGKQARQRELEHLSSNGDFTKWPFLQ